MHETTGNPRRQLPWLLAALLVSGAQTLANQPSNDACVAAIPIGDGTYAGTTAGATPDGADSCGGTGQGDVWYLYTAPCDGTLYLNAWKATFPAFISIESAGCTAAEEWCGRGGERVVTAGEQKLIRISGQGSGTSGDFELTVSCDPPPPNDACVDAIPLEVGSSIVASTVGVWEQPELLEHWWMFGQTCGEGPTDSVGAAWRPGLWYRVIGTGRRMTASTCNPGTERDTEVLVFCGDCHLPTCLTGGDDKDDESDPACHAPNPCDNKICSNSGEACSGPSDCPSEVCIGNSCSLSGDPCSIDEDCPAPDCQGGCSHGRMYSCSEDTDCETLLSTKVTWCSRAGQEYLIRTQHRHAERGDIELSVFDDDADCGPVFDCSNLELVDANVSDNGDGDGWADDHETVELRLGLFNRGSVNLTGLEARLSTDDPRVACIANPVVPLDDLQAGERRIMPVGFRLRVADVGRTDAQEDLAATLRVVFSSDQNPAIDPARCSIGGGPCEIDADCTQDDLCDAICLLTGETCYHSWDCPQGDRCVGVCSRSGEDCEIGLADFARRGVGRYCEQDVCLNDARTVRLELDLDAVGGAGLTTYFESFESEDLGSFTEMNLDAGLGTPQASEGYRCQYMNPDYWQPTGPCSFASNALSSDAYHWGVDLGRAFSGLGSLRMGIDLAGGNSTIPLSALEAAGSDQPINLAATENPELRFKHQAELVDRTSGFYGIAQLPFRTGNRAVVQLQLADDDGLPLGDWIKLEPYYNGYHANHEAFWEVVCSFDPIDDGNTEDDYFEPNDPGRRYGPSSTCFPEMVFSNPGDTWLPFDTENTGWSYDGPGLAGEHGLGTWVESRVSLWPYRGHRVRLRFLTSTLGVPTVPAWGTFADGWGFAEPLHEGWWVDDVTVTHTLVEPVALVPDTKDNSGLGVDADADCIGDTVDCDAADSSVWSLPGEVRSLRLSHAGGVGGTTMLQWISPAGHGGTAPISYTLMNKGLAHCMESAVPSGTSVVDTDTPEPGELHTFLLAARNPCGVGSWGEGSAQVPRQGCP